MNVPCVMRLAGREQIRVCEERGQAALRVESQVIELGVLGEPLVMNARPARVLAVPQRTRTKASVPARAAGSAFNSASFRSARCLAMSGAFMRYFGEAEARARSRLTSKPIRWKARLVRFSSIT